MYSKIGYELHGTENLPDGPGLVIYYHGAIPVDYLYFLNRLFVLKHRLCYSVADEFVFKLPGDVFFCKYKIILNIKWCVR